MGVAKMDVIKRELSEATIDDIEAMVSVYLDAFAENHLISLIYGFAKREELVPWFIQSFGATFRNRPEIKHLKVTEYDVRSNAQKLIAWLRYEVPYAGKKYKNDRQAATQLGLPIPPGINLDLYDSFCKRSDQIQQKYLQHEEMIVAHLLAVHPAYQNKGIGEALANHLIKISETINKPIFIQATASGLPLYHKLGCLEMEVDEFDLSKWAGEGIEPDRNWVMIREVGNRVNAGGVVRGPVVAGPVVAGPVVAEPVVAGPVVAGPVVAGPVVAGPVAADVIKSKL